MKRVFGQTKPSKDHSPISEIGPKPPRKEHAPRAPGPPNVNLVPRKREEKIDSGRERGEHRPLPGLCHQKYGGKTPRTECWWWAAEGQRKGKNSPSKRWTGPTNHNEKKGEPPGGGRTMVLKWKLGKKRGVSGAWCGGGKGSQCRFCFLGKRGRRGGGPTNNPTPNQKN